MNFQKSGLAVFIGALVVCPWLAATAEAKDWIAGGGDWNVLDNWSPVGVPTAGEAVNLVFTDGVARTITYNPDPVPPPALGLLSIDLTGPGTAASTLLIPGDNSLAANGGIFVGGYNGAGVTNGRGALIQSAGTVATNPGWDLVVGHGAGSTGDYTLTGGALVANQSEFIGFNGTGTFNHAGGTNTINASGVGSLDLGGFSGATGTYNLSGTGALSVNTHEYVGDSGTGFFNHMAGTNTITGAGHNLYLGFGATGVGTYTISGTAALSSAGDVIVGNNGTGTLTIQDQASVHITNSLTINNLSAVNLNGGTLRFDTVTGLNRLNYNSGTIQLAGSRTIGTDSTIKALFGTFPSIPTGKGLTIEGVANVAAEVSVNGGSLSTLGELRLGSNADGVFFEITNGGIVHSSRGIFLDTLFGTAVSVSGPGSTWKIDGDLLIFGGNGSRNVLSVSDGALLDVGTVLIIYTVVNLDGGTIRFNSLFRNKDLVTGEFGKFNFNAGTIQLAGNRSIGSDAAVIDLFGASPTITAGKGLTVEGTATLSTVVTLDGGTLSASQLANGHNLRLQRGTLNIANQAVTIGAGGLLGGTLDLNDDMTVNVNLGITNQGLVTGDGQIGGTFTNAVAGELRADPGKSLTLTGGGNTNDGRIRLLGGALDFKADLTNNAGAFISGNGSLVTGGLTNNGTMNFAGTANIVGDVINSAGGKTISGGGGATIFYDDVTNDGEIRTSTNGFTVFFGDVTGAGTFTGTGTVNFEGDLSPGNSPATVEFAGDVVLGPDATLRIEIGGAAPGTEYDQIHVTGELTLDGTLEISLINGFVPAPGQTFDFLDWGSFAGEFSAIVLPNLPGLNWNLNSTATTFSLTATPSLLGDINLDGTVNGLDVALFSQSFGLTSGSIWTTGDFDGDARTTLFDLALLQSNLGQSAPLPAAPSPEITAVPEPASIGLLLAAMLPLSVWHSRRRESRSVPRLPRSPIKHV